MRVAALDLGSNTSLLLVAEVQGGVISRVIHDETTITRMGQGVHAYRRFHPEALVRVEDCLARYAKKIVDLKCDAVVGVATSAARDVANGQDLLSIGQKYGIPIHIVSGTREAELTFQGALCDRDDTEGLVVIDVGGGSTELITRSEGHVRGVSVDVGSVRLTELFVTQDPPLIEQLVQVRAFATQAFSQADLPTGQFREVIAVAGTPTTLAALDQQIRFQEKRIHGFTLTLAQIDHWIARLAAMSLNLREALPGMQPKRADVIVPGAIILRQALVALKQTKVTVSTRGVRYGVVLAWENF